MSPAGILFSVTFVVLIVVPGVAAWFLGLSGPAEDRKSQGVAAPIIEFPLQSRGDIIKSHRIDAA